MITLVVPSYAFTAGGFVVAKLLENSYYIFNKLTSLTLRSRVQPIACDSTLYGEIVVSSKDPEVRDEEGTSNSISTLSLCVQAGYGINSINWEMGRSILESF
uniref:Uncharacterized protein n=1 Tax=Glossina palpalis gambiensis TaxID=67801 RepID=A0A1B0AXM2_9MUSC